MSKQKRKARWELGNELFGALMLVLIGLFLAAVALVYTEGIMAYVGAGVAVVGLGACAVMVAREAVSNYRYRLWRENNPF